MAEQIMKEMIHTDILPKRYKIRTFLIYFICFPIHKDPILPVL